MLNSKQMLPMFKQLVEDGKIHLIQSDKLNRLIYLIYKKKFDKNEGELIFKAKTFLAQKNKLFLDEEDLAMFVDSMDEKTMMQILESIREMYLEKK